MSAEITMTEVEQLKMELRDRHEQRYPIPVVCAYITRNGKVLLERHAPNKNSKEYKWDLPGGKIEYGESPEDALKREMKEELGIEIIVGTPPIVRNSVGENEYGDRHWILITYPAEIIRGVITPREDLQWCDLIYPMTNSVAEADRDIIWQFSHR